MQQPLEQIFENMDRWRHLPAYQLERRADIFFSIYLRGVVAEYTGRNLHSTIIPELPIRRDLIWPDKKSLLSVKVDYVLFTDEPDTVLFVELKTDAGSRRDDQDTYLHKAEALGFRRIVEGIVSIAQGSKAYQKYYHLLRTLQEVGFLRMPDDIEDYLYPKPRPGLSKKLEAIEVCDVDPPIEVIYLQPIAGDEERCIDFETFAKHLDGHDDKLSRLFASYLRRWRQPAG